MCYINNTVGKFLCNAVNDYGRLSAFGPSTTCSVSCGSGGIHYRATAEDYLCVDENVESRKCNQLACPINGGWGKFSEWSKCPKYYVPIPDIMEPNIPKIKVTLNTYKPIPEETFLEHLSRLRVVHDEAQTKNSSSSNNLESDSTESVRKDLMKQITVFRLVMIFSQLLFRRLVSMTKCHHHQDLRN
ncbi:CLUMA_CG015436, isoform A, partial [Clunio marinus]